MSLSLPPLHLAVSPCGVVQISIAPCELTVETSVQGTVSLEQGLCCETSPVSSRHGSEEYLCWDRSGFCQDMSFLGLPIKEKGHILP